MAVLIGKDRKTYDSPIWGSPFSDKTHIFWILECRKSHEPSHICRGISQLGSVNEVQKSSTAAWGGLPCGWIRFGEIPSLTKNPTLRGSNDV
jgi:hypothetical protein